MDFREFAAKETSDLAARLTKAATSAAEEAAKQVRDEAQKVADSLRDQLQTANKDLQAVTKDKDATAERLKEAQAQVERLKGELKSATDRIDAAGRQLDDARKATEKLESARADLTAARDEQAAGRRTAEADLRKARDTVDSLRGDLASATKALEHAQAERLSSEEAAAASNSQSQAAEAKLSAVSDLLAKSASRVKTLEQGQQDAERKIQGLESKLQSAAAAPPAAPSSGGGASAAPVLDELLGGFAALASAANVAEVLTTMVEQLAAQFPRVALFRVKKGHLQGEHQIGFDLKTDIGKLVLPLGMDSLPARAASSGQIETLSGDELKKSGASSPFSGTPTCALALPMAVGEETLAIIYADDSGAPKDARGAAAADVRTRYAEAIRHFAGALLMRLKKELKALAELQKYAASLLHEMEQMYDADVDAGLTGAELQKRLVGNLDFARSIYGSRAALEGADAATLIDDEIGSLIEQRHGTPFARDLAEAAGHSRRNAAEAS